MRLKVMHVCRFYPSKHWLPVYGGIEVYVYNCTRYLANLGCEVEVISSLYMNEKNHEIINNVKIERLKPLLVLFKNYSHFPVIPHLFLKLLFRKKLDIIHAHINSPFIVEVAALVAMLRRIPFVVTYQADVVTLSPMMNALYKVYKSVILRFILNVASAIIITTKHYLTTSQLLRKYSNKLIHIPNGVTPPIIQVPSSSIRNKYLLHGFKNILFVGRLVDYKGVWYLIYALKCILNKGIKAKLLIVGDGPLRDRLYVLAKRLGVQDNVIFCGPIPNSELSEFYNACDVFVLPSITKSEGFGIVLLEAMIHGKPVVASEVGGIPEIVVNDIVGYLVKPADPEALCSAISKILLDEELAFNMGNKAKEFAMQFTWAKISRKILNLYLALKNE